MYYISTAHFNKFFDGIKDVYEVYISGKKWDHRYHQKYNGVKEGAVIGEISAGDPYFCFKGPRPFVQFQNFLLENARLEINFFTAERFEVVALISKTIVEKGFQQNLSRGTNSK